MFIKGVYNFHEALRQAKKNYIKMINNEGKSGIKEIIKRGLDDKNFKFLTKAEQDVVLSLRH